MRLVVGVDPPRAVSVWGEDGPMYCWQSTAGALDARVEALTELRKQGFDLSDAFFLIESGFGAKDGASSNPRALQVQGQGIGWWETVAFFTSGKFSTEQAGTWRKRIGISGPGASVKDLAHRLASKATDECGQRACYLYGPMGGKMVDAAESMMIALSAWVLTHGWTGAAQRWKTTGAFK